MKYLCSLAAAFMLIVTAPAGAADAPARPNIIFIMSDDHAAHAVSAYGSRINTTPNIDRLSSGGMRLQNCFATNALCAPSRAAILTGKYSHRNGVYSHASPPFDGTQPTLPSMLKAAGYRTGIVGKWHLESDPVGFDYWNILPGQGLYHNPRFIVTGTTVTYDGYVTDLITSLSLAFIRESDPTQPFFLMCHHKAPHRIWQPSPKYETLYEGQDIPEPPTFDDDYAGRASPARTAEMRVEDHLTSRDVKAVPPPELKGRELKQWHYQRYIKDYLRCVASIDDSVGEILDFLSEQGLTTNTIVIYTSDQGFFLGDHGWYDKRFMYEESLRMPFLVQYPAEIPAGGVSGAMALNVDFAPTLLEYAGVPPHPAMQGRSMRSVLGGKTPADWRDSVYYHFYEYPEPYHNVARHYGVRTDRYKLIHYYHPVDEWELFDLQADPHELRSVHADPQYQDTLAELRTELSRLRADLGVEEDTGKRPR